MFSKNQKLNPLALKEREWFIIVDHQQHGPYNLQDLKQHPYFNPDTLVWKKGFLEWTPARFVTELQEVFKDESDAPSRPIEGLIKRENVESDLEQSQATLTMQQDPYPFILWILIAVIIVLYTVYQFYY